MLFISISFSFEISFGITLFKRSTLEYGLPPGKIVEGNWMNSFNHHHSRRNFMAERSTSLPQRLNSVLVNDAYPMTLLSLSPASPSNAVMGMWVTYDGNQSTSSISLFSVMYSVFSTQTGAWTTPKAVNRML